METIGVGGWDKVGLWCFKGCIVFFFFFGLSPVHHEGSCLALLHAANPMFHLVSGPQQCNL